MVSAAGIAVNGTPIPHSAALPADEAGRALKSTANGAYAVTHNEVWVISGHDPRSFDSRYWGPVPIGNIQGIARPVFVSK